MTPTIKDLSSCSIRLAFDLNRLRPRKAAGPDEILAKDLLAAGNSAIEDLNTVFCKSFNSSRLPSKWKLARVSTLSQPTAFYAHHARKVAGKPVLSCARHNLYSNNQWGFRKGGSSKTLLLSMTERWRAALDDNKIVGAIFIDFRKAFFDTNSHELLPFKLQAVGIISSSYN